jgi:hypothetical protein
MLRLGIKNLRRLEAVPPIELKPITVLVGRNSSGKSTFSRTIPLLRQSITTRTSSPILWYGDLVDFADFDGSVFDNQINRDISFIFGIDNIGEQREFEVGADGSIFLIESDSDFNAEVEICIRKHKDGTRISKIILNEAKNKVIFSADFDEAGEATSISVDGVGMDDALTSVSLLLSAGTILPRISFLSKSAKPQNIIPRRGPSLLQTSVREAISTLLKPRLDKRVSAQTMNSLMAPLVNIDVVSKDTLRAIGENSRNRSWAKALREITSTDKQDMYPRLRRLLLLTKFSAYVNSFSDHARRIISSALYIGPARARSDRYYRYQDLSVSEIDPDGKNFAMFLNSLSGSEIDNFSQWIKQYFDYGIGVSRESGHISIKLIQENNTVNIVDTGYGISQILPVLGQIWWANNRRRISRSRELLSLPVIIIEQPELHLHPAHQAKLADAFVHSIQKDDAKKRPSESIQFLIETHSEALINRLGALISEGKVSPSDVQIVLFEPDDENERRTAVKVVNFDQEGQLINWPYGFFSAEN